MLPAHHASTRYRGFDGARTHRVRGIVQGVGFRPFVYRLASALSLDGWVRNDGAGVTIEVQGDPARVARLAQRLAAEAPPRARVDSVAVRECEPARPGDGFAILDSGGGQARDRDRPRQLRSAPTAWPSSSIRRDRRYRYAFINCTNCGPRYTITRALALRPRDDQHGRVLPVRRMPRRVSRPGASALSRRAQRLPALRAAARACSTPPAGPSPTSIRSRQRWRGCVRGEIVAIKGLGGFHLACDARNGAAVARLRARKAREEKPFAVMVAEHRFAARPWPTSTPADALLLASAERPIVLMRKGEFADAQPAGRRAGPRVAGRDAAVHAAAVPAVPRGGGPAGRHRLARRGAGIWRW